MIKKKLTEWVQFYLYFSQISKKRRKKLLNTKYTERKFKDNLRKINN